MNANDRGAGAGRILQAAVVARIGIKDLELRTGVDRSTLWRWYKAGKLPAPHYLGDKRVWFLSEIEAWEAEQMARPASARRGAQNLNHAPAGATDDAA